MSLRNRPVHGTGLGLRRALLGPLQAADPDRLADSVDFMEVAPENWINVGGRLLRRIKDFLDTHGIRAYTEHLSYCSDAGHLYDLMPIPFTGEAVGYVAERIRRTQDTLERRIGIENVSYYAAPGAELSEIEFINAVVAEADCDLLLDVNNIYVDGINHRYDPVDFLRAMPGERIVYGHIAGHDEEAEDLRVDTHGAQVIEDVWGLLDIAYEQFGPYPTLLERDFNFPPVADLLAEVDRIGRAQDRARARRQRSGRAAGAGSAVHHG